MELYQIIIAILATYRLSQLLPEDDGPLFIFTRLRGYTLRKRGIAEARNPLVIRIAVKFLRFLPENNRIRLFIERKHDEAGGRNPLGVWTNIDEGINCVYCCGLYAALLVVALVMTQNFYANLFLLWFAIAGGQTLIERLSKR